MVPLGDQPGFQRKGGAALGEGRLVIGPRLGGVEAEQRRLLGHLLALLDQDGGDDATFKVLDHLALGLHPDHPGRDHGAVDARHGRRPAEAEEADGDERIAQPRDAAIAGRWPGRGRGGSAVGEGGGVTGGSWLVRRVAGRRGPRAEAGNRPAHAHGGPGRGWCGGGVGGDLLHHPSRGRRRGRRRP